MVKQQVKIFHRGIIQGDSLLQNGLYDAVYLFSSMWIFSMQFTLRQRFEKVLLYMSASQGL